jgi:hypothetical protein
LVEEFGTVESTIAGAINDVSLRFTKGRDPNYLPPADAFCVVNVLDTLLEDDKAAFYPYDPRFKYERIGVATKSKEGYSKFTADPASKCPFNTMVWHESHLNLSLQTSVKGTIQLNDIEGKTAKQMGFSSPYPTFVFRNFTFIKDGHVNIKTFYLTSSEETYKEFKNKGIVLEDTFKKNETYAVDLSKLPAINRVMAEGKTSATDLCKKALAEQKLKAQIKGLKWLKDQELGDEDEEKPAQFTDEQAKFLEANGIQVSRGGLFSPPTEKEDPKDFYMAKFFDVKLSGINSLPTVKKVAEKIASDKPRTPVEALIEDGIVQWNNAKAKIKDKKETAMWFTTTIKAKQDELKTIRQDIQTSKFSVILGRKWFDEFSSRDNCELTIDGVKCSLALGEEKVPV